MPSRFLDADQIKRLAEHRYDFNRKALAGRVVLVPGGAGGLGAAITALLLQDGALPVVAYRSQRGRALAFQQKLQDLYGGPVTLVEADVATPEGRRKAMEAARTVKGEIYGLVTATGDPARVKPEDLDGPALHASFAANFEAPVLLARACAEEMKAKSTHGAICSRQCRPCIPSRAASPTPRPRPRWSMPRASWPASTAVPPTSG